MRQGKTEKRPRGRKKEAPEQKEISFRRLTWESLPEMWSYQFFTKMALVFLVWILKKIGTAVIGTRAAALTTANLKSVLLSWQGLVFLVVDTGIVLLYIIFDIFAQIIYANDILKGTQQKNIFASVFTTIKRGFQVLPRFLNLSGIPILIYIFIAVPLVGFGFSISLTKSFHIPNFIMEVILNKPLYRIGYTAGILALLIIGLRSIFCVHGVIISGLTPKKARQRSRLIIKKFWKPFLLGMLKTFLICLGARLIAYLLIVVLPDVTLAVQGVALPANYNFDLASIAENGATDTDVYVLLYRFGSAFVALEGTFLLTVVRMLASAYMMLSFTRYYLDFTRRPEQKAVYMSRPVRHRYLTKAPLGIVVALGAAVLSIVVAFGYNYIVDTEEPVKIVAHRTGGYLASENSIEGINQAVEHGCYGSETDVQRTLDGHYVINHDNDFKRLTGVAKKPSELTLAEIKELKITDTTGNGELLEVPTIEELLDASKGRIKLFIELKGETADRQMVDDIVQIVREKDCVDDVALISLNYDIIDYAETTYPEFETGVLFFAAYGDLTRLNADVLAIEEEAATGERVGLLHLAGKQAFVWTVNTATSMQNVLDSGVDAVITDDILLAEETQAKLDARSDFQVIQTWLGNFWG